MAAPEVVELTAPTSEFSAARAIKHIEAISRAPHPVGSLAHAEVRDYLVKELTLLGLTPEIQQTSVAADMFGTIQAAQVENVLARIKGKERTGTIALLAHYDSVPHSRGASDDGSGVATLLETARALLSAEALQNDVILVFTDAEENGLLGARAFLRNHQWAKEIRLFLNFEARGHKGPSTMFRASLENGGLIPGFARAAPYPVTSSLLSSLANLLPNDTDFSVLSQSGIPGFDFAYAGGLDRYHTYEDSLENLDPKSLQHHGSYALSLTRYFGKVDLSQSLKKADLVYFDLLQLIVVYYPKYISILLGLLNLFLFCFIFRKNKILLRSSSVGLLAIISGAISVGTLSIILGYFKNSDLFISHSSAMIWPYLLLSFGVYQSVYFFTLKEARAREVFAGALLPWVILGLLSGFFLSGASYIFQWPVLFSLVGYWLKDQRFSFIFSIPAVILITGLCYMIFVMEAGAAPQITAVGFCFLLSFFLPIFLVYNFIIDIQS